jgi:hypothetical protein
MQFYNCGIALDPPNTTSLWANLKPAEWLTEPPTFTSVLSDKPPILPRSVMASLQWLQITFGSELNQKKARPNEGLEPSEVLQS